MRLLSLRRNPTELPVLVVIFFVVIAIQVIGFTFFIIVLSRDRDAKGRPDAVSVEPVSVIVCAHDEEQNLRELIPQLLAQKHPAFEIIIVEDRSNDNTYDYLLELTRQEPRVRMVRVQQKPEHVNGKKYALTLGIKAAQHDWVVLTDADCRPASDQWLTSMAHAMQHDRQIVLGYSPYQRQPGFLNLFIRFDTLITGIQYVSMAMAGYPYMGVGRNLAYRKSLFLDNRGFNDIREITGGDDDLFVNRHATGTNTGVEVSKESLVYSIPKTTWSGFITQKIRHLSVGKYYRFKHKLLLGLFSLTWMAAWFLGIPLLWVGEWYIWIASLLAARTLLFVITAYVASSRLSDKFEGWTVPLLDFLFAIYYISTGPVAFLTKKVRWKT
jgi:cellulose synthase/poly-beta-1,6-N-acetylglucosamine synthase-like glycosyltransferase